MQMLLQRLNIVLPHAGIFFQSLMIVFQHLGLVLQTVPVVPQNVVELFQQGMMLHWRTETIGIDFPHTPS